MPLAPAFAPRPTEAMHCALKQAADRARLAGATLLIELIAIRILELARAGEFDPDKIIETLCAEFDL